jgi:hypothetical protein
MSVADLYFVPVLFILIPLIILHIGAILSYYKANHRKSIGVVLVIVGCVELSFLWFLLSIIVLIYILTIVVGIISLLYAFKVTKN